NATSGLRLALPDALLTNLRVTRLLLLWLVSLVHGSVGGAAEAAPPKCYCLAGVERHRDALALTTILVGEVVHHRDVQVADRVRGARREIVVRQDRGRLRARTTPGRRRRVELEVARCASRTRTR